MACIGPYERVTTGDRSTCDQHPSKRKQLGQDSTSQPRRQFNGTLMGTDMFSSTHKSYSTAPGKKASNLTSLTQEKSSSILWSETELESLLALRNIMYMMPTLA